MDVYKLYLSIIPPHIGLSSNWFFPYDLNVAHIIWRILIDKWMIESMVNRHPLCLIEYQALSDEVQTACRYFQRRAQFNQAQVHILD
jgi:hypothetical protein